MTHTSTRWVPWFLAVLVVCLGMASFAGKPAPAPNPWSLLDSAAVVATGDKVMPTAVQMTSSFDSAIGGEVLYVPTGSLYFQDIYQLSTAWKAVTPWGGGSPRFSIGVDLDGDGVVDGWAFAYVLQQFPYFYGEATDWLNSGNLIGGTEAIYDLSQFGGSTSTDYATALSMLSGGKVMAIVLVTDGGWFTYNYYGIATQVVWANNITVNSDVYSTPRLSRKK
jgi:hypothetical protein